ncbi:MDR family MFS transporter [Micromonospora sp. NPDC005203]|uniref:MDR family MFS transporter n=1 Tax=Micromonospora sp. NPDC005203 TaxID=3364226 RepID=UPI0036C7EB88
MSQGEVQRLDPALRRLIGVVLLGGIMGILDGSMIAVAADRLAHDFGTSLATVSWVSASYLLALTVTIPVTAWAVDRVGGRRLWLGGLAVFLIGSILCGLAWNVESLIAFRVLQGIGAGLVDPLMLTLLARAAGGSRVGRVMGLMGVVGSSGPVLGPIVGGIILESLSWRWMFLVNVPIGLLALALSLRTVPRDADNTAPVGRLDVIGIALLGPGVAAGVLALSQVAERGTVTNTWVLAPLAAAVLLLGGYAWHALRPRRTAPLIDLRLFTRPSFAASVLVGGLVGLVTFASIFALPLYQQLVRGHDTFEAALLLAPLGIGSAISMPLAGRRSDRVGARLLALGGATLAGLSALAFTQMGPQTSQVWVTAASFTIGFGLGAVGAPTIGSLYRTLPAELVPQGSSVLYMLNQLGASIGIAAVAVVMLTAGDGNPLSGFHAAFWTMVGALAVLILASNLLPGRLPAQEPQEQPPAGSDTSLAGAEKRV